ncbi:MAG: ABC transporter permease [Fimbriimonadaceae bacterium]|nr:ABC transporter permease [Fimbriimonadaceae bacterium]
MTVGDSLNSALRAIIANKLRSILTMLGVVIGVGSVIAMIGIGEGTKSKAIENLAVMGSNMITIVPDWRRGGQSSGIGNAGRLSDDDVRAIKKNVPTVELISGAVRSNDRVKFGSQSTQTSIYGVEPQMAVIRNAVKLHQGKWFTAEDNTLLERKAVLGWMVYDNLFGGENAIGATIKIKNQNFEVVGVISYKGGSGFMNPDDQIYIPLRTAQERLMGKTYLDMISVQVKNGDILVYTQGAIEDTLYATRKNAAGEALFRVFNQGEMIEQIEQQTALLSYLLAGIASVSLLVGGIGIMNIMLVSVTERTREIGLRKAIGAKRHTIMSQFLFESIVMCLVGGSIGILLGSLGVKFVAGAMKVPPIVSMQSVIVAFVFSAMVGLFFGLYPAMRASALQPIEALRHE